MALDAHTVILKLQTSNIHMLIYFRGNYRLALDVLVHINTTLRLIDLCYSWYNSVRSTVQKFPDLSFRKAYKVNQCWMLKAHTVILKLETLDMCTFIYLKRWNYIHIVSYVHIYLFKKMKLHTYSFLCANYSFLCSCWLKYDSAVYRVYPMIK